ncbi:unnamed protein product [Lota lota]
MPHPSCSLKTFRSKLYFHFTHVIISANSPDSWHSTINRSSNLSAGALPRRQEVTRGVGTVTHVNAQSRLALLPARMSRCLRSRVRVCGARLALSPPARSLARPSALPLARDETMREG